MQATATTPATPDDAMGRYASTYDEETRNIAELMNALPANAAPWVKDTLRECAKLYARKHGIKMTQVRAAAADYAAWEQAFEQADVAGRLQ
jgi:hypothetical protein